MSTAKEELENLLKNQPDDATTEELVKELAFHLMVDLGLADSDAGRTVSNAEAANRIRRCQR